MRTNAERLALASDEVLERYAARIGEAKGIDGAEVHGAFSSGVRTVYRVVAFDVDGTLTLAGETTLDPETVGQIARLLDRAVPVTLVTGRGRSAARDAVSELQAISGLRKDELVRLSVVTHNGLRLLETPPGGDPLERDLQLCEPLDVEAAEQDVLRLLAEQNLPAPPLSREPGALRLEFGDEQTMRAALAALELLASDETFVSGGLYGHRWMVDVSPTTKALALDAVARRRGVAPDRILRIGDQGQEDGNDYYLLDSPAGWSVGGLSASPTGCWPVLDQDLNQLVGAAATKRLLSDLLLFAPLTTLPEDEQETLDGLLQFERRAQRRADREAITARSRLRLRIGALLAEQEDRRVDHANLQIRDIYDTHSGAVRFREWELDEKPLRVLLNKQFGAEAHGARSPDPPEMPWCMYTDTALILRGPHYYWEETHPGDERAIGTFITAAASFLETASDSLDSLGPEHFSFGRFKLVAGILDNVRNLLLHLLVASYGTRGQDPSTMHQLHSLAFVHTELHMRFLFAGDDPWQRSVAQCGEHVQAVLKAVTSPSVTTALNSLLVPSMRECDCFIENIMAVDIGLRKLRRHFADESELQLTAVGLLRGGVELPVLAEVIAQRRDWRIDPALLRISIYSGEEARARVREGDAAYVERMRSQGSGLLASLSGDDIAGTRIVLMDDNCTTATTLQNARDLLVLLGHDVVGAVVVRYPGVNRRVHMALENHGFPDPEALFGFIRGLVAPSPYTRLLIPGEPEGIYRDQRQVFNKSKQRIERYLQKNGTPALDSQGRPIDK
jgi:hypothetical protein